MLLSYLDLYPEGGAPVRVHDTASCALTDATGLLGTTRPRGEADDIPEADGGLEPADVWMAARAFVLSGEVFGGDLEDARQQFAAIDTALRSSFHSPLLMRWQPDNPNSPHLEGYVRLAGEFPPLVPHEAFWIWTAQMRAADPYWVSQSEKSSTVGAPDVSFGLDTPIQTPIPSGTDVGAAVVACRNDGNGTSFPRFTIHGPIVGPAVENLSTGDRLVFPGLALAADQVLEIDTSPQAADHFTVNGSPVGVSPRWSDSTFPVLAADVEHSFKFYGLSAGYGAATLFTVTWRDTYI